MSALVTLNDKVLGIVDSSPISKMGERVRINNRLAVFLEAVAPEFHKVVLCGPVVGPKSPMFKSRSSNINVPNVEVIELPDGDHLSQGLITRKALKVVDFVWLFYGHAAMVYYMTRIFKNGRPFGIHVGGDVLDLVGININRVWLKYTYLYFGSYLERKIARNAKFVMSVGNGLHSKFTRIAGAEKVYNIPPLLEFKEIRTCNRSDTCNNPNQIICLFIGRITYSKGCQHLIEAIPILNKRGHSVNVRIIGDGEYLPALKECAARLGVLNQVFFTGHIKPGPYLWAEYEKADIFVQPSFSEGLPKVLYEAAVSGLPLITTPVGGIKGVFSHEKHAMYIVIGSSESIADAIVRLIEEPLLRRSLIANVREVALKYYEEASRFGELFTTLVKRHVT